MREVWDGDDGSINRDLVLSLYCVGSLSVFKEMETKQIGG